MTHKYYISHTIKLIFKTYKKLVKYLFYHFFLYVKIANYQNIIKLLSKKHKERLANEASEKY